MINAVGGTFVDCREFERVKDVSAPVNSIAFVVVVYPIENLLILLRIPPPSVEAEFRDITHHVIETPVIGQFGSNGLWHC